jgi:hypothetical protein
MTYQSAEPLIRTACSLARSASVTWVSPWNVWHRSVHWASGGGLLRQGRGLAGRILRRVFAARSRQEHGGEGEEDREGFHGPDSWNVGATVYQAGGGEAREKHNTGETLLSANPHDSRAYRRRRRSSCSLEAVGKNSVIAMTH